MKKIVLLLCLSASLYAQQAPPKAPPTKEVSVKDTPAQKALLKLAKDSAKDSKELNDKFQQARTILDKKNKPLMDSIASLQKQISDNGQAAQVEFQNANAAIQQKVQVVMAQMQGLVPVVRLENSLPDTAQFNPDTGKWVVPVDPPKEEPAKPEVTK